MTRTTLFLIPICGVLTGCVGPHIVADATDISPSPRVSAVSAEEHSALRIEVASLRSDLRRLSTRRRTADPDMSDRLRGLQDDVADLRQTVEALDRPAGGGRADGAPMADATPVSAIITETRESLAAFERRLKLASDRIATLEASKAASALPGDTAVGPGTSAPETAAMEKTVVELRDALAALKVQVAELAGKVDNRSLTNETLISQVDALRARVSALSTGEAEEAKRSERLRAELSVARSALRATVKGLSDRIATLETEQATRASATAQPDPELAKLRAELSAQIAALRTLQTGTATDLKKLSDGLDEDRATLIDTLIDIEERLGKLEPTSNATPPAAGPQVPNSAAPVAPATPAPSQQ